MSFRPITIRDVTQALDALTEIERPDGDNEGDPINSTYVYESLSNDDQALVDRAETLTRHYLEQNGKRAVTELNKHGYRASFNPDQYDPDRLVGQVNVGDWSLNVSDPSHDNDD